MAGEESYGIYRIEQGLPLAPNELNDVYNPQEAGLIDYVDFDKGCFIGQEVIARLQNYDKVQKRLTGLKFNEPIETNNGQITVEDNGKEVGTVTSYTFSYKLNSPIGLAYIHNSYLKPKTQLLLKLPRNKVVKAEVHLLPFFK